MIKAVIRRRDASPTSSRSTTTPLTPSSSKRRLSLSSFRSQPRSIPLSSSMEDDAPPDSPGRRLSAPHTTSSPTTTTMNTNNNSNNTTKLSTTSAGFLTPRTPSKSRRRFPITVATPATTTPSQQRPKTPSKRGSQRSSSRLRSTTPSKAKASSSSSSHRRSNGNQPTLLRTPSGRQQQQQQSRRHRSKSRSTRTRRSNAPQDDEETVEEDCNKFHDSCDSMDSVSLFPLHKESSDDPAGGGGGGGGRRRSVGLSRSNSTESFAEFLDLPSEEQPQQQPAAAADSNGNGDNNNNPNGRKTVLVIKKKKTKKKGGAATPQRTRPAVEETPHDGTTSTTPAALTNDTPQPQQQQQHLAKPRLKLLAQKQQTRAKSKTPKRRRPSASGGPTNNNNNNKTLLQQLAERLPAVAAVTNNQQPDQPTHQEPPPTQPYQQQPQRQEPAPVENLPITATGDNNNNSSKDNVLMTSLSSSLLTPPDFADPNPDTASFLAAVEAVTAKIEQQLQHEQETTSHTALSSSSSANFSNTGGAEAQNHSQSKTSSSLARIPSLPPPEPNSPVQEDEPQDLATPSFSNDHARLLAPQFASVASRQFDAYFTLKDPVKEKSVCTFHGLEVVWEGKKPLRRLGHYIEFPLKALNVVLDFMPETGQFGSQLQRARDRLMLRSTDGSYCVKYVQPGLLVDPLRGPNTVTDLVLELRILQNLPGHPNIAPLYAMHHSGIDALTEEDSLNASSLSNASSSSQLRKHAFFWISDRIQELLPDRFEAWRNKQGYGAPFNGDDSNPNGNDITSATATSTTQGGGGGGGNSKFTQRLEVALDISSALLFLHDRGIVFHIRPDKVGFDAKHGCLKLFNFSEARQEGLGASDQSAFLTESTQLSTLAYTAPEVLCNARHITTCSDVYGFGILLWQIVALKAPFEGALPSTRDNSDTAATSESAGGNVRNEYFEHVIKQHKRPRIRGKWPHDLAQLLEGCWDPYLRMTMKRANELLEGMLLF